MGTRSIIAIPDNDTYKGRYCHWDGYPSHMGHALCAIVNRDGIAYARQILTADTYGWSTISASTPSILGVTPDPDAPYGSAERLAADYELEDRFAVITGYGIGYTDTETVDLAGAPYQQTAESEWYGPDADCWQEWIYVLRDEGLEVLDASGFSYGVFAYDDPHADFAACEDRNDEEVA